MHENLFSYIHAEGCCTKCKCVGRESRANLFAHDRGQHLALERSESAHHREEHKGARRTPLIAGSQIVIPARACAERSRSKRESPFNHSKQALRTERLFFCTFCIVTFLKVKNYIPILGTNSPVLHRVCFTVSYNTKIPQQQHFIRIIQNIITVSYRIKITNKLK